VTGRKSPRFTAFLWHRRAGLAAIVLVIILAVTGLMLNHTEDLDLDERFIESPLLLNWYGLEPRGEIISYAVGNHSVSQWDKQVFFDNRPLSTNSQRLHGAVSVERMIVAAFDSEILLLTPDGELIERVPTSQSFSNIRRLGVKFQRPVIETTEPLYFMADEHILDWDVIVNEDVIWSQPSAPDEQRMETLRRAFRGNGLSMERVVLDLHSGRIFGKYGHYLMDAAALALLWLSCSGLWVWWSRRRKLKQKRHYQKHHRL
jgi:hypothetical protein